MGLVSTMSSLKVGSLHCSQQGWRGASERKRRGKLRDEMTHMLFNLQGGEMRFYVRKWHHRLTYLHCWHLCICLTLFYHAPPSFPKAALLCNTSCVLLRCFKVTFTEVMDCVYNFPSLGPIWWTKLQFCLSLDQEERGGEMSCAGDIFVLGRLCPL